MPFLSSMGGFHGYGRGPSGALSKSWVQRGLDIDGEATANFSGYSISISSDGNIVAIGAFNNDGTSGNASDNRGHVRVWEWNGSSWIRRGIDIDGEASGDRSGWSVSLSSNGSVLAIGADLNDGAGASAGHVRVWAWNGTSWVQRGADIDGEAAGDQSGWSVSLSSDGNVLAIGAYANDGNGSNSGHVRVWEWNSTSWVRRGADIDGEAAQDQSGISVSLSSDGTVLAVGAITNDGTTGNASDNRGHVRVWEWNTISWVQRGADIDGEAANDNSGYSVSLSSDGTILAVGATANDGAGSASGHVRVWEWNGTSWVQLGADIDGEAANDQSGISVSLSSDGTILAIGAPFNDGNGTDSGHVRVYNWNGTSWIQLGTDINGEAANNNFGVSVSLSSDGSILAIGANFNDGTTGNVTDNRGHVRVYEYI